MPITFTSRKDRSQSSTSQLANLCQDGYFSFFDKNNAKLLLYKWLVRRFVRKGNDLYESASFVHKVTIQNSWVPVLRSPSCTKQRTPAGVCRGCCHKADHKYYCRETRSAEIKDRFVSHRLVYPGVSFVRTMTGKVTLYFSDISGSKEVSIWWLFEGVLATACE